jgi:hypothetical protein
MHGKSKGGAVAFLQGAHALLAWPCLPWTTHAEVLDKVQRTHDTRLQIRLAVMITAQLESALLYIAAPEAGHRGQLTQGLLHTAPSALALNASPTAFRPPSLCYAVLDTCSRQQLRCVQAGFIA